MTTASPKNKIFPVFFAGLAVFVLMLSASGSLPLCWDEGDTFDRAVSVQNWFSGLFSGTLDSPFADETLKRAFPNTISREGHPAGYVLIAAAGKSLGGLFPFLSEKIQWRFGPILLFSLACGAVFYRTNRIFGCRAVCGIFAAASILLIPRLFVHAQITFCDSILLSSWLLSWAFFFPALEKKRYALVFGLCLGLTASAKFSGILAVLPFGFGWICSLRTGRTEQTTSALGPAVRRAGIAVFTAFFVFFLLNPPIWHHPTAGLETFFYLNTHRGAYNIAVRFLGETYNLDKPLPVWNTLLWTAITLPPGLLLAIGYSFFGKNTDRFQQFAVWVTLLNGLILLIVRSFPGLPVHDGVRLFVPAFGFLGILAGIGLYRFWCRKGIFGKAAAAVLLLSAGISTMLYFPNGLSYYNLIIGGLAGAQRRGMESAYYWDSLDQQTLRWINQHTDADGSSTGKKEIILFSPASSATLKRYRQWGDLQPQFITVQQFAPLLGKGRPQNFPKIRWYVLQTREGVLSPVDKRLIADYQPVYTVHARPNAEPVLRIYPYLSFLKAIREEETLP